MSEEFTLVIISPHQILGLMGSRYNPDSSASFRFPRLKVWGVNFTEKN